MSAFVVTEPHLRKDPRTDYMKAVHILGNGAQVPCCPFGCGKPEGEPLEANGYCKHLLGFTNAPLAEGPVKFAGDHKVEVLEVDARRAVASKCVTGKKVPLKAGDILVRITHSSRVYCEDAEARINPPKATANAKANAPAG